MTLFRRACVLGVGLLTIAAGLGLDLVSSGSNPGIGPFQLAICALGVAVLPLAVLPVAACMYYARGALALGSTYAAALAVELTVRPPVIQWGLVNSSQQGMVQPAHWGGYELTPGWHGRYEDGVLGADVSINALGYRDDPPSPADSAKTERVLLLGDSFAFGWGLEKGDTVEAQIERQAAGRAVAYSLGVGGYGPGDTLEHYRERATFPATHTFFLLYGNDLRVDNCKAGIHTAVDGVVVPSTHDDGSPYTTPEVEQQLATARQQDARLWLEQLKDALRLSQVRARLTHVLRNDYPLATGAPDQYTPECALAAAARAAEMSEIARARGQQFAVVILPTPGEALQHMYFERMQACIQELERRSIPVLQVREQLTARDFFAHHEHLNASGARKVATQILASVESVSAPPAGYPQSATLAQ